MDHNHLLFSMHLLSAAMKSQLKQEKGKVRQPTRSFVLYDRLNSDKCPLLFVCNTSFQTRLTFPEEQWLVEEKTDLVLVLIIYFLQQTIGVHPQFCPLYLFPKSRKLFYSLQKI